ncbi:ABC transporter ATP-binding protein [Micromonospora siamensis]|uniref:ATP-binding cassette, subfamily B n=1 Tax=Micromonospora siamensis TaxID=299152 RepID=A0A1C5JXN9_9ACTN|nr:ABC transporter ATP-binding protein [Micromonospora siamensis]SCG75019.1 ATP-binding cassette, subfamily B [Micromonospora siamensis]
MTRLLRVASAAWLIAWRAARGLTLAQVAAAVLGAATPLAVAWQTKVVFDRLAAPGDATRLAWPITGLVAATVLTAVPPQVLRYLRAEHGRRVGLVALERLYTAVNRLVGLGRFEDPQFADRLRFARQAGAAGPGHTVAVGLNLLQQVLVTVGFAVSLVAVRPMLAAVVVLGALPAIGAEFALSRRRAHAANRVGPVERRELFYGQLLSDVDAATEVRLFAAGAFLRDRMLGERRAADRLLRSLDRRTMAVEVALTVLSTAVAGGCLAWTVWAAAAGRLSIGDVAMLVAAVAAVQGALLGMVRDVAGAHTQLIMFDHYLTVVEAGSDLPVPAAPLPVTGLREGIEFRDVWFRYREDLPWVLRGVSFTIPHGRSVALVGHNGAGKSTVVKLLCRFYDPGRGAILWDGVDLRDLDPVALRARIAAVFQDFVSYELSAAENIGIGDVDALPDRARLEAAGRQAGVHEVLRELPHGYDTLLSRTFFAGDEFDGAERGTILSGGQWQRVAVARGFLRGRRDLMILDEPSARLDAEAEHQIHQGLQQMRGGGTTLLISHRLGSIRDADLILVLDAGAVAATGRHDDLVNGPGLYSELFSLQAAGYHH